MQPVSKNILPVRLSEVAAAAGVSMITVSRCVSNPGRVSDKTRERVLEVAASLGYIPNRLASSLASSKTMVIGAIVPTISNPVHAVVLQGVTDTLEPAGYQLLVGNSHFSPASELSLVQTFLGHRVDAVLLTGKDHNDECIRLLQRSGVPVVEMFDYIPEPLDLNVGSSNFEAGLSLAHFLIARHRKTFVFVGHAKVMDSRMQARYEGLVEACRQRGLAPPVHYTVTEDPASGLGGEVVGTILRERPETDAILFAGHQLAVGAIRYASDIGIDVPGHVAIAGFGESPIARWIKPSLTTVRFPVYEIGVETGRMLIERFSGIERSNKSLRMGFEILARESA